MPIGHAYKFFGFSISYIILNIPLSTLYLLTMLPNPRAFFPIPTLPSPADDPPNDLHIYDTVPVLLVA